MGWLNRLFRGQKEEAGMKGGGGHMAPSTTGMKTAKDPVCGMDVNIDKAAATSVYQGQTYYFCAVGCKKTFDQNPAKYTEGRGREMAGHSGHRM